MKRFLAVLLVFTNFLLLFPSKIFAVNDAGYFVVTAYYSPLPDQEYYLTGNYESEIRLN
jgi:hypothetical protein